MKGLVELGLNIVSELGVDCGEVRAERRVEEEVTTKNHEVDGLYRRESRGICFRVLWRGAWGFAATSDLSEAGLRRAAEKAVAVARATSRLSLPVELAPEPAHRDTFRTPYARDPLAVPVEEKLSLLFSCAKRMLAVDGVVMAKGSISAWRVEKWFGNTDGSLITQVITSCGAGIEAYAAGKGEIQRRSYPNSFGGDFANRGYEFIEGMDLPGHAEGIAEEAARLVSAPVCPTGTFDIIIDGSQMALQVHESLGHPAELDRVLGTELSYAGGSFLTLDKLGEFRYGSEIVNIVADATAPGALGSFGYDDEGVPAQRVELVREGVFCGYLTSRETAGVVGLGRSGGAARAASWAHIPLIRMTNINLLPGEGTLEDLIADTEHGIYFETNKSWSIDDRRVNFQFGTELAWEIRGGRRVRLLKNPLYTGLTPDFWRSCVAIAGPEEWRIWGLPNCGKGEPGQVMQVGHGAAPAKFRKVRVLGAG
ncbi:TldD/PmbA family protein [Candidatus Bipolaricaulota bacterium]|nr:TldD/PmbA family protein [Candidatus Bipolaricaulota bacterium]